jgi:hypothetical protein
MSRRERWMAALVGCPDLMKAVLHEESIVTVGRGRAVGLAVRAGRHGTVLRRRRRRKHGQLHRYSYRERNSYNNGYSNSYSNSNGYSNGYSNGHSNG